MSPEQFLNSKVDARSDIYSFGCVVHQMLSGKPPFEAPSLVQLMGAHHHRYRDHFAPELNVPGYVDDVLDAATMKMPGNRYASAAQMVADLQAGKCSIDLNAARRTEPAADEQAAQRQQTIKMVAMLTAGSVLVVALIIFIAGFDSMSRVPHDSAKAPPAVAGKSGNTSLKNLIDNGQYSEAIAVVANQLSFAEAAGERTENFRERLAMLMFLNKQRAQARTPLVNAIATRQNIAEAEPDTKAQQEAHIRNDYALLGLTYVEENPDKALEIAETHLAGHRLVTQPQKELIHSLQAHFPESEKAGMRLRDEFASEIRIGYTAPEATGELNEYLISEAEKD
jgi:hypothetical protein